MRLLPGQVREKTRQVGPPARAAFETLKQRHGCDGNGATEENEILPHLRRVGRHRYALAVSGATGPTSETERTP